MGIRYKWAQGQPTAPEVKQEITKPAPASIPAKYSGSAAVDAQTAIEGAADEVFSGVDESIAVEAARRALSYPSFSADTAREVFATFRDEVQEEKK